MLNNCLTHRPCLYSDVPSKKRKDSQMSTFALVIAVLLFSGLSQGANRGSLKRFIMLEVYLNRLPDFRHIFIQRIWDLADTQICRRVTERKLWKLKPHCPYKMRPEFSNIQRMKALQAFNGVYSGLLTTILYYWQTKSLPDKTISLTAYLISIGLDRPIPFSIHKISYKSYNQRLLMYWWKYWH